MPVQRATSPLWLAQKPASNVLLAATPALVRACVPFAPLVPSTRQQGLLLCLNATNVQWVLTAVQAPQSAPNALKEVTRTLLDLLLAAFVRQAHPAPSKVRFHPVSATPALQPNTRASLAPPIVMLAPLASRPLPASHSALHCVRSVSGQQVGWIFPMTAAHHALLVPRLRKSDLCRVQRARPDYSQTDPVKSANLAVSELSAVVLAPASALHASAAHSAIHWAPPNALPVPLARILSPVKASALAGANTTAESSETARFADLTGSV